MDPLNRRLANRTSIAMVIVGFVLMSGSAFALDFLQRTDLAVLEFQLQDLQGDESGAQSERRLILPVPRAWEAHLHEEGQSSRIRILTPLGSVVNMVGVANRIANAQELRALVTAMGLDHLDRAVESELELLGFTGKRSRGFYFQLTDANPAPGEWANLTAGFFVLEDSLWMFQLLSHERGGLDEQDLIESLKHIRLDESSTATSNV